MSKRIKEIEKDLHTRILEALGRAIAAGELPAAELPAFIVEIPQDRANGDYATNVAFAGARAFRMAPVKIAQAVERHMDLSGSAFASCTVAGAGFINFRLNDGFYADIVRDVLERGADYGKSDMGCGERVNVEFVSANPTGPMHMGNARGGALGDCLAAVLEAAGYDVTREFYINDAGNQIEKFGLSLDIRYQQLFKGEAAVELPEDSYHGADIIERAKEFADLYGDSFLEKPEAERRKALVDFALPKNIQSMQETLAKYRIEYDVWFRESELHKGAVQEVIDLLTEKGKTYEKDGALWYKNIEVQTERLTAQGKTPEQIEKLELKDDVLVRQNGNPTYFAADIAYHKNKLADRGFSRAIDVWGADHHGHVARMQGALDAIGLDGSRLQVVLMQLVNLMKDGEPVRMSKRTGNAVTLNDLLDEVPVDAARFFFNMREPGSTIDFDLGLAVSENAQNPVYYCQYAHARICSILKKLAADGVSPRSCTREELTQLRTPEEHELIRHLAALTGEIEQAAKSLDPAGITRYAVGLATLFHKYYNACKIAVEDEALMQARLNLCLAVKQTIVNILTMFKITVPESM
ncbi:MAG TPA: arginine--tRNA ligase [Candidatus Fimenecus stercoravium]|nr:arginine--tRNA ligase [Candidatus Fimenecus stercoravium]